MKWGGAMSGGRKAPQLTNPEEIALWDKLMQMQGTQFCTSGRGNRSGVQFTYTIRGAELFASTKEKSITRASIISAYWKARELDGLVSGPKKLGVFGASYLYPIFIAIGVIKQTPINESVSEATIWIDSSIEKTYNAYTRSNKNPERELTDMPRPKGSKNKKVTAIVENVDEKIAALETDIEKMTAELKTKKAELKQLAKAKVEAEKAAAARKAEEDKQKLLAAVEQSGKSIDEILEMLK